MMSQKQYDLEEQDIRERYERGEIDAREYHREMGDAAAAWEWAEDAMTLAVRAGYHHLQGLALIERGLAAWALNNTTAAEDDLLAAIQSSSSALRIRSGPAVR